MSKRFIAVFFTLLTLLLLAFAGVIAVVDPYLLYHAPLAGLPLRLTDGRYQNAGIARNLDYDALVVGTSVSANFQAAQFDRLFEEKTAKLIVLDGYFSDFQAALDIAFKTHDVKRVFWGIDSNILGRTDAERTVDLPEYLYNQNPFDDVSYLLNKDVFFGDAKAVAGMALSGEAGDGESGGFLWGQSLPWSRSLALVSYVRPEQVSQPVADDALLPAARENLAVILQYVQAHPDTEFTFYLVPYSILFWDQTIRTGRLDAVLAMHKLVLEALTALPNARVFYFLDSYDIITDLDNYGDHIHFSPHISALLAERMAAEAPMEASEISARLAALRDFAEGYDYEAVFAG